MNDLEPCVKSNIASDQLAVHADTAAVHFELLDLLASDLGKSLGKQIYIVIPVVLVNPFTKQVIGRLHGYLIAEINEYESLANQ